MKNLYLKAALITFLNMSASAMNAQSYQRTFGGTNNDSGRDFEITPDGGCMIAGQTYSFGAGWSDVYVIKTNSSGVKEWEKTFGGGGDDYAYSIVKVPGGGYVIAGSTKSMGAGSDDFYLLKIDENGNKVWEKAYGTSGIDIGREAVPTADGGFIFIGYTQSNGYDMMLIKTSGDGNEQWRKTYGGGQFEHGYSVKETTGGYILLGTSYTYSNGAGDAWVVKTDASGIMQWNHFYGGVDEEEGQYIEVTQGGYIFTYDGFSNSMGDYDIGVTKITDQGVEIWTKLIGGTEKDVVKMVKNTSDGGYIVTGISRSFAVNPDFYIIKMNSSGTVQWAKSFGGQNHEHSYATKETSNGDFISVGHTQSFGSGMDDVYLIRINSQGVMDVEENRTLGMLSVYPNPANEKINLQSTESLKDCDVKLMNVTGQQVYSKRYSALLNESIDIDGLSKGIYFLHVSSDRGEQTTKLVID